PDPVEVLIPADAGVDLDPTSGSEDDAVAEIRGAVPLFDGHRLRCVVAQRHRHRRLSGIDAARGPRWAGRAQVDLQAHEAPDPERGKTEGDRQADDPRGA